MSDHLFNGNHESRLRTTFKYIDELLTQAAGRLDSSTAQSPFSDYHADATPVQHRVTLDHLVRLRSIMLRFLQAHDLPPPEPRTSAVWAARTALMSVETAVEELRPRHLRGYGDLSDEAARELDGLTTQLRDQLRRLEEFLAQGVGHDLRARLQRLERPIDEGRLLQELERIITTHGLVEYRGTLEMLVERLESRSFEVAVFGRVSSGKSSLLNYLLGFDALPIGVTPVTAVPVRIVYGSEPRAVVHFAESSPATVPVCEVGDFATEQRNPANAKHVTRIRLELPAALLREGVTFVDTPGVGSLALSGAAESAAYLPRSDLGIVLVDASSTLTPDDVTLVHTLLRSGAEAMVLLTKADIVGCEEREPATAYASEQLRTQLGIDVPVHAVSVKGPVAKLCARWQQDVLLPSLNEHRKLVEASLRRKIAGLRDGVRGALRRRRRGAATASVPHQWNGAESKLTRALAELEGARWQKPEAVQQARLLAAEVVKDSAARLNGRSIEGEATRAVVTEVLNRYAAEIAADVVAALRGVRTTLIEALAAAAGLRPPDDNDELPTPTGLPVLDLPSDSLRPVVHTPWFGFLGKRFAEAGIRGQLGEQVQTSVANALDEYARRLEQWRKRSLADLERAFTIQADLLRAESHGTSGGESGDPAQIDEDLQRLEDLARTSDATSAM